MANRLISTVADLRFSLNYDGRKFSPRDEFHVSTGLKLFILVCSELSYYQPVSPKRIVREISSLKDLSGLVRCQDHLLRVIRSLEPVSPEVVEEAHLGFLLPTLRAWEHHHRVRYFRTINEVAQFLKNMNLKDLPDDANLEEFRSFQSTVKQLDRRLAEAVSDVLQPFEIHDCEHWKFGPGASYEVPRFSGIADKIHLIHSEPCNYRTYRLLASMGYRHVTPPGFDQVCARAIAVPKSIKTKRIITVEPTFNTMATQALRSQLIEYIADCDFNVNLEWQEGNRMLAQAGSANGSFGTVDLHAASDSVTCELVDILFRRTGLLPYLHDARVTHCEVKGEKTTLTTYAGMGNAVTFPLECIVFSAIVEYVLRGTSSQKRYLVYGDDIVVPREHFDRLCDVLVRLGFVVNKEKSFNGPHPFRESCGIEALGGFVVTPCRIPRGLYFEKSNRAVDSLMEFSNNLYDYGLHKAASAVRQWFRLKSRGLPYVDDINDYGMFIWSKPDNTHLRSRFNHDLQRHEIRYRSFSGIRTSGNDDDRYRYWLMARSGPADKIAAEEETNGLPDIPIRLRVGSPIDVPRWYWKQC